MLTHLTWAKFSAIIAPLSSFTPANNFFLKNQILTPQRLDRNILGKPPLRRTPAPQQPTDTDTLIPLPLAPDPQI
jgi:hypothetical protein